MALAWTQFFREDISKYGARNSGALVRIFGQRFCDLILLLARNGGSLARIFGQRFCDSPAPDSLRHGNSLCHGNSYSLCHGNSVSILFASPWQFRACWASGCFVMAIRSVLQLCLFGFRSLYSLARTLHRPSVSYSLLSYYPQQICNSGHGS